MTSQTAVLRHLPPTERVRLMFGLIDSMRRAVASGVRYRRPEYTSALGVAEDLRRLQDGLPG